MEGKKGTPQQQIQNAPHWVDDHSHDETSLYDLWRVLMQWKALVLGVALVVWIIATAYALLATPIYKAEAFLLPPSEQDVQGLNGQGYAPEKVFGLFVRSLQSRALRRRYFDEHKLADYLAPDRKLDTDINRVFDGFNKALSVIWDKNKNEVLVSFEGRDASLASRWVNDFIALASKETTVTLIRDVSSKLDNKKMGLREKIAAKREKIARKITALRKKEENKTSDKIVQLKESIKIASSLGIVDPFFMTGGGKRQETAMGNSVIIINTVQQPLYMRGSKALEAEVRAMQLRKKHIDAFVPELRDLQRKLELGEDNPRIEILRQRKSDDNPISSQDDLQEKLAKLERVRLDPSVIRTMQIDQPAMTPSRPFKPKRGQVVLTGLFGGLALGICAALIANFFAGARRQEST